MAGEGSLDVVLRNDIRLSALKFGGGGGVMVFGMIAAAVTGHLVRLHCKINATVTKRYGRNIVYLI